ncbi:hypothetical protein P3X46_005628 [Hevea brasiliensis]|uniref:Uncharacterized protein n=2 Tax=Hevea brasiliensis TaxID=3981 RepID=A0A6A6M4D3_HEVBR|nr:hypothetical protein GH714_026664 [Hevea brasiliensis]KAJ9186086.1 hypothetical protein P3X46_005628 [Hevea brasiliensis]
MRTPMFLQDPFHKNYHQLKLSVTNTTLAKSLNISNCSVSHAFPLSVSSVPQAFAVLMRLVKDLKNGSVLKLVHPGGFVEVHQCPIRADEVMKKNPRHCVTRPDVFRFPWIVVRPESLLKPGGVFYIVPFHTIHRLLQRNRCQYQDPLLLQLVSLDSSVEVPYFHQLLKQQDPNMSPKRTKVDCKIDDWPKDIIFPKCVLRNAQFHVPNCCEESLIKSRYELEHFDDFPEKPFPIDLCHASFGFKVHQEPKQQAPVNSFGEPRSSLSLDIASTDARVGVAFPKVDSGLEPNSSQEYKPLKSCFKKDNNAKSRGLRVKFALPYEDDRDDEKIKVEIIKFQPTKSP